MKRCPVDQGGCGELVEMLFDSGLCQKCDAQAKRGTAAAGGVRGQRSGARDLRDLRRHQGRASQQAATEAEPEGVPERRIFDGQPHGHRATTEPVQ